MWRMFLLTACFVVAGCGEREPGDVRPRGGIPEFARKMEAGEPLIVGFLGGSITENADDGGFVTAMKDWLARRAPGVPVRVVNAGLGSTDSAFGSRRVTRDVLVERPDLVFVEFLVNDGSRDSRADMERIVRTVRGAGAEVVFLYAMTEDDWRHVQKGGRRAADRHEAVAEHHGVPTLFLGTTALERMKSGEWKWSDFSPDACHPTEAGYGTYRRDFELAMDEILRDSRGKPRPKSVEPMFGQASRPFLEKERNYIRPGGGVVVDGISVLPLPGIEWTGSADFPGEGTWKLAYVSGTGQVVDFVAQRWFAEERAFTGAGSRVLAETDDAKGVCLHAVPRRIREGGGIRSELERPVIVWRAPAAGRYGVSVRVERFEGRQNAASSETGWRVWNVGEGGTLRELGRSTAALNEESASFRQVVELAAGEGVALELIAEGVKYVSAQGVEVTIQRDP